MKAGSKADLPKIGYLYHYPKLDHPTDKFRLDIFLSSQPTEQHFDVLRVVLPIQTSTGVFEQLKITHPWNEGKSYQLCMGVVRMEDRLGKKEEAFSFGGEITITAEGKYTSCSLVSPAPILEISGASPIPALLIEELEILLAEHKAANPDVNEYETRLCSSSPEDLYQSFLFDLIRKFEDSPHKTEEVQQLLSLMHSQAHRFRAAGLLKEPILSLGDLLGEGD
jgi:hypothetical protein